MGTGTGTQDYKGDSISESTTQHLTGGKTYSPALQPLSAAWLTTSAFRKANFICPSSSRGELCTEHPQHPPIKGCEAGTNHQVGKTTQQGHAAGPQV